MEVKFETVRIGNFRKDNFKEKILKENYLLLKENIRNLLKSLPNNDEIQLDIVIPARGFRVTFTMDGLNNNDAKNLLEENFPYSIFKGNYSKLLENSNRDIFRL